MGKRLVGTGVALAVGLTLAGCSSSSSSTATTTTTATTTSGASGATSGGATAQAVAAVFVRAVQSGSLATFCVYAVPSEVAACRKDVSEAAGAETFQNIALGTVTTQGDKAVVALTGTICPTSTTTTTQTSRCISNTDPNVASKDNQTFAEAYAGASSATNQNSSPFVTALVRRNGRWYATGF